MKNKKNPNEMTFLEHLEELRTRIIRSVIYLLFGFILSWFFVKRIYYFISLPVVKFLPEGTSLAFTSLTEPFMMYIKLAFLSSIFVVSPLIFYEFWQFISPALEKKEKSYIIPFILFSTLFFIGGAGFGYFVVFPFACNFFLQVGKDFTPIITVDQYFSLAVKVILSIAVVFELPILIFFLARVGIITYKTLLKYYKYAILIAFIIAAVITPTPDMITQSIIAIPLIGLYTIGILIAFIFGKKPEKSN